MDSIKIEINHNGLLEGFLTEAGHALKRATDRGNNDVVHALREVLVSLNIAVNCVVNDAGFERVRTELGQWVTALAPIDDQLQELFEPLADQLEWVGNLPKVPGSMVYSDLMAQARRKDRAIEEARRVLADERHIRMNFLNGVNATVRRVWTAEEIEAAKETS